MKRRHISILIGILFVLALAGCYPAPGNPAAAPAATASVLPTSASGSPANRGNTPTVAAVAPVATGEAATPTATRRGLTAVPLEPATPAGQENAAMTGTPTSIRVDPSLLPYVDQARQDLSRRTGIPAGQIAVVEAQAVTWPDKGLGCPQPGMQYAQVQVDGLRIVLNAGGRTYEYHSGDNRGPFLCE